MLILPLFDSITTDWPMDQQTKGVTNERAKRLIELRVHNYKSNETFESNLMCFFFTSDKFGGLQVWIAPQTLMWLLDRFNSEFQY